MALSISLLYSLLEHRGMRADVSFINILQAFICLFVEAHLTGSNHRELKLGITSVRVGSIMLVKLKVHRIL
jgi:hypothetical protein